MFFAYHSKFFQLLRQPLYPISYFFGLIAPRFFRLNQHRLLRKTELKDKYFILSFDCDTSKDIEVVAYVHERLRNIGITPTYAVPGELLIEGATTYRKLFDQGSEFINHGYKSHTTYFSQNKSYVSTLFYEEMNDQDVREVVIQGHKTFFDILGKYPLGFRTPHFGGYQSRNNLRNLYSILAELKYSFSSSTSPYFAMWKGPAIYTNYGIWEFPVSGCYDYPVRILDSWGFRFSPTRRFTESDYISQFQKAMDYFDTIDGPAIFNIYADPSQVFDWEDFFVCMKMTKNLKNISFAELTKKVSK